MPSQCFHALAAAAGRRQLSLWCQTGDSAGGSEPHEFWVSRSGGVRWTKVWSDRSASFDPVAVTFEGRFLATSVETLLIERPDGSRDWIRFDASVRSTNRSSGWCSPSPQDGFVLTAQGLYRTRDAGRRWHPVQIGL